MFGDGRQPIRNSVSTARAGGCVRRETRGATLQDVAARANVSIATVSRVLNGIKKANDATGERVRDAARSLSYYPARAGRALRLRHTQLVALLIPDISNTFYAAIARSIEIALRDRDHTSILCNTGEDPELQDFYLAEMQSHRVRGVALLGAVESPGLARAQAAGLPIAFVNRKPSQDRGGVFVGIDNRAAGRAVAQHFLHKALVPCAAIRGPQHSSASRERFEGYRDELSRRGVELPEASVGDSALSFEGGYIAATSMLSRSRPRAIFCGNDLIAYGVSRRCRELSIKVPNDLALFGFDDNPLNEWVAAELSTVRVPHGDFGVAVADALARLWQDHATRDDVLLPFEMMLRGSA